LEPSTLALLLLLAFPARAADQAACPAPSTRKDVEESLDMSTWGYLRMDPDTFWKSDKEAVTLLGCLGEAMDQRLAESLHVHEALAGFLARDEVRMRGSLRAVSELDPAFVLPEAAVPVRHHLHVAWDEVRLLAASKRQPLPASTGWFLVDGAIDTTMPVERPFFLQWIDEEGAVRFTVRLVPGESLPATTSVPPPPDQLLSMGENEKTIAPGSRTATLLASAGFGIAAVALAGVALWEHAGKDEVAPQNRRRLDAQVNALGLGAGALGIVGVGIGVSTLF
jgi:hypothetical protein